MAGALHIRIIPKIDWKLRLLKFKNWRITGYWGLSHQTGIYADSLLECLAWSGSFQRSSEGSKLKSPLRAPEGSKHKKGVARGEDGLNSDQIKR